MRYGKVVRVYLNIKTQTETNTKTLNYTKEIISELYMSKAQTEIIKKIA